MSLHLVTNQDVLRAFLEGAKTPIEKLRAAITWTQEALGVRILHGDYGVVAGAQWEVDERRRPKGVSPLGAVVLGYQPPVDQDLPEPAAGVLGVSIPFAEGCADGFDRDLTGHYLGAISRRQYLEGVEVGFALRFDLTKRCERCGSRHLKADRCPLCEDLPEWAGGAS